MPVAFLLLFAGIAAIVHWLILLLAPATATGWDVTDSLATAQAFIFAPTALAGCLLAGGAVLMLAQWSVSGRVVATVGLGLAILFALYWGVAVAFSLGDCASLTRGCGREWGQIVWSGLGFIVAAGLAVALWSRRRLRSA